MPAALLPPGEAARLAALHALAVLDTPPEPGFDDLTRLAAHICGVPIALVSLVDRDRQWFKSCVGLPGASETPRDQAFCAHAILTPDELLEVPDATADPRFADNPLVTGPPGIRFYAGVPIRAGCGQPVGTLCAIDTVPRALTAGQRDALRALARQVADQFRLRSQLAELGAAHTAVRHEQERFHAFINSGPVMAFMKDAAGRYVYVNDPACDRFGLTRERWLGRTDADLWGSSVAADLMAVDREVLASGRPLSLPEVVPTPDGASQFWQVTKFPMSDPAHGRLLGGVAVDVTAERRLADSLRASEERFREVIDHLSDAVAFLDPDTRRLERANPAFLALLGYTAEEAAGLTQYDFVAHDPADIDARVAEVARLGRHHFGDRRYRRKGGGLIDVSVDGVMLPAGGRAVLCLVVRDESARLARERAAADYQRELEGANQKLMAMATSDRLTGLANRAAFQDRLAAECERAARLDRPLSVLMIDVDHFKGINDRLGHQAGDEVLAAVAGVLRATVRGADLAARYGGEEFVVLLPDTDHAGAVVLGERVRRAVAEHPWPGRPVTVSVGASSLAADVPVPAALIADADAALYRAKRAGRNRFEHGSGAIGMAALTR
jgi:diguanylate cyclase (GGDEF)-like protein/PAS domain S-box-containing protein